MNARSKTFENRALMPHNPDLHTDEPAHETYHPSQVAPIGMTSLPNPTTHTIQLQRLSAPNAKQAAGQLQRAYGNRYVNQVAQQASQGAGSLIVQPKLTVTPPNDQYEQEADRVADQVMRQIGSGSESKGQDGTVVANDVVPNQASPAPLMCKSTNAGSRLAGTAVSAEAEAAIATARGTGQPLPVDTKSLMERGVGTDLSKVRVHTDAKADALNQEFGSRALTTGQDIFLKQGEYSPGSTEGQRLLAHELAHVAQQSQASVTAVTTKPTASSVSAAHAAPGQTVQLQRSSDRGSRRQREAKMEKGKSHPQYAGRPSPSERAEAAWRRAEEALRRRRAEAQNVSYSISDERSAEENLRRIRVTSENYRNIKPRKTEADGREENLQEEIESTPPENEQEPVDTPLEKKEKLEEPETVPIVEQSQEKSNPVLTEKPLEVRTFETEFPNAPNEFKSYCSNKSIDLDKAINAYDALKGLIEGYVNNLKKTFPIDNTGKYPQKLISALNLYNIDLAGKITKKKIGTLLADVQKIIDAASSLPASQQAQLTTTKLVKSENVNPPLAKSQGPQPASPPSYQQIAGDYHGKLVFGWIDWQTIESNHHKTITTFKQSGFDYKKVYGDAMIASLGDTNSKNLTCTKPEGNKEWVVKISYKDAQAYPVDHLNIISPLAIQTTDTGNNIYLKFYKLVNRH